MSTICVCVVAVSGLGRYQDSSVDFYARRCPTNKCRAGRGPTIATTRLRDLFGVSLTLPWISTSVAILSCSWLHMMFSRIHQPLMDDPVTFQPIAICVWRCFPVQLAFKPATCLFGDPKEGCNEASGCDRRYPDRIQVVQINIALLRLACKSIPDMACRWPASRTGACAGLASQMCVGLPQPIQALCLYLRSVACRFRMFSLHADQPLLKQSCM